jgi:hypothetical protein
MREQKHCLQIEVLMLLVESAAKDGRSGIRDAAIAENP